MLKKIREFYNSIRINKKNKMPLLPKEEVPITFVKIFHKEYPRLAQVELPRNKDNGELEEVIKSRKSNRHFSTNSLDITDLSKLLEGCQINEREGYFERRAYPSAGARFPVEIYPIVFNAAGLDRGAYHFNSNKNCLELLLNKDLTEISEDFVSPFIKNPALAIVMTSVISRAEVKYGLKAYPFSLIEAGHIAQNISLLSAKYNIGCCAIGGFIDETISDILDLSSDEIPIYSLAFGKVEEGQNE